MKKICTCSLASEFPEDCKFYPADTKDELHKVNINRHRQLSKVEFVLLVTFKSNICYAFMRQVLASSLFNLLLEVSHAFTSSILSIYWLQFMYLFKEQRVKVPHWRNQRPYLMAHKV